MDDTLWSFGLSLTGGTMSGEKSNATVPDNDRLINASYHQKKEV